jgi:hypothetical protein
MIVMEFRCVIRLRYLIGNKGCSRLQHLIINDNAALVLLLMRFIISLVAIGYKLVFL